jgi:hypothetical protein
MSPWQKGRKAFLARIQWAERRKEIRDAAKKAKEEGKGADADGTTVDRPVRPTDVPESR